MMPPFDTALLRHTAVRHRHNVNLARIGKGTGPIMWGGLLRMLFRPTGRGQRV